MGFGFFGLLCILVAGFWFVKLLLFKLLGSVRLLLLLVGGFWCFGGERPVFSV